MVSTRNGLVVAHKDGTLELFNTNDLEGLMSAGRSESFQPPFRVEAQAFAQIQVELRTAKSASGNLVAVLNSKSGGKKVLVLDYIAPREAKEEDWWTSTLHLQATLVGVVIVIGYQWYKRKRNQPPLEVGDGRRKPDNRSIWNPS